jgi:hypothetical protein
MVDAWLACDERSRVERETQQADAQQRAAA